MQPLYTGKALAMQGRIDVGCARLAHPIALLPGGAKAIGVLASAKETGPVARRKRRRLIEKEQLGPATPAHHPAPPAAKFQHAGEPGMRRPALLQQRAGFGIVNDAAVAGEHAAIGCRDDVADRGYAVLQGHWLLFSLSPFLRGEGWGEGAATHIEIVDSPPHPTCFASRPLPARGARWRTHAPHSLIGG